MCSTSNNRIAVLLGLLLLFVAVACPGQQVPLSAEIILPTPPQQHVPWQPHAVKWLDIFAHAAAVLFDQGLPDPRGCAYRAMTVRTGETAPGQQTVPVHGWLLPAQRGLRQRYAICWNGMMYPVQSIGKDAALTADVQQVFAALKEEKRRHIAGEPPVLSQVFLPDHLAFPGESHTLKIILLLRLGKCDLARQLYLAVHGDPSRLDPYGMLAGEQMDLLLTRAFRAYCCGENVQALAGANRLRIFHQAVLDENARQQHKWADAYETWYQEAAQEMSGWLAEAQQRLQRPPVSLRAINAIADKPQRIAALISALDEVQIDLTYSSGDHINAEDYIHGSPILSALLKEGPDAVVPLLHCMETDTRLTRSTTIAWYDHGWPSSRPQLVTVWETAYIVYCAITNTAEYGDLIELHGSNYGRAGVNVRKNMVAGLREAWETDLGLPWTERWYRVLADDKAMPDDWLSAAESIVRRGGAKAPAAGAGASPQEPMLGESLRARKGGLSVTQLMQQRIDQLWEAGQPGGGKEHLLHRSIRFTLALAHWDPPAAAPVLRVSMQRGLEVMKSAKQPYSTNIQAIGMYLPFLAIEQKAAGDQTALPGYITWITATPPPTNRLFIMSYLAPIWRYPNDPAIKALVAAWVKNDPPSPWSAILQTNTEVKAAYREAYTDKRANQPDK